MKKVLLYGLAFWVGGLCALDGFNALWPIQVIMDFVTNFRLQPPC
jgi:hypothetical protein